MKKWNVRISFINLNGEKVVATISDNNLMNILHAVDMVPTAKVLNVIGERKAA